MNPNKLPNSNSQACKERDQADSLPYRLAEHLAPDLPPDLPPNTSHIHPSEEFGGVGQLARDLLAVHKSIAEDQGENRDVYPAANLDERGKFLFTNTCVSHLKQREKNYPV